MLPLCLLLLLIAWWLQHTLVRPVGQVSLFGEVRYLPLERVEQLVRPSLAAPFWRMDLAHLQRLLQAEPWVAEVDLMRRWPDQLEIHLVERQIWARWGERGLLDEQGEGFVPAQLPELLPELRFDGAAHQLPQVVALWRALDPILQQRALSITKISLAPRGAWQFELNGSIRVMLGRDNIEKKINQFLWIWDESLGDHPSEIRVVDLRYPNGLSVKRSTQENE
ncbi:cell division protein FtsQ/DivIB [Marinospirillum sp.]|uniref:cell division protein FtsQ/DivIB n=1 Tax=Marinospirillum sp. TaxID=2183934 RepID=UPI003A8C2E2F